VRSVTKCRLRITRNPDVSSFLFPTPRLDVVASLTKFGGCPSQGTTPRLRREPRCNPVPSRPGQRLCWPYAFTSKPEAKCVGQRVVSAPSEPSYADTRKDRSLADMHLPSVYSLLADSLSACVELGVASHCPHRPSLHFMAASRLALS